jgi:hypothetical protein
MTTRAEEIIKSLREHADRNTDAPLMQDAADVIQRLAEICEDAEWWLTTVPDSAAIRARLMAAVFGKPDPAGNPLPVVLVAVPETKVEEMEEAVRLTEVGEYLYNNAFSYGDGYSQPREFSISWEWSQSSPDEYGQGVLLAESTKWHRAHAEDGVLTEATKLRSHLRSLKDRAEKAEAERDEALSRKSKAVAYLKKKWRRLLAQRDEARAERDEASRVSASLAQSLNTSAEAGMKAVKRAWEAEYRASELEAERDAALAKVKEIGVVAIKESTSLVGSIAVQVANVRRAQEALETVRDHFDGNRSDKDWIETERVVRATLETLRHIGDQLKGT